jgi:hypothetical protein
MAVGQITRSQQQLPVGTKEVRGNVGGHTYPNLQAFMNAFGKGHAIMAAGDSVKIKLPRVAERAPHLAGLDKSSPFTTSYRNGMLTITAKENAKFGAKDTVGILSPSGQSKNFTLEVGVGRLIVA